MKTLHFLFSIALLFASSAWADDKPFNEAGRDQVASTLAPWAGTYEEQGGFRVKDDQFARVIVRISAEGIEEGLALYSTPSEQSRVGEKWNTSFLLSTGARFSIPPELNGAIIAQIHNDEHGLYLSRAYIVTNEGLIASPYNYSNYNVQPGQYSIYMTYKRVK